MFQSNILTQRQEDGLVTVVLVTKQFRFKGILLDFRDHASTKI